MWHLEASPRDGVAYSEVKLRTFASVLNERQKADHLRNERRTIRRKARLASPMADEPNVSPVKFRWSCTNCHLHLVSLTRRRVLDAA